MLEDIRAANRELADEIASRTETAIGDIRQQHTTIIRPEVRHEREIHKVLQDPACALPESTVGVLNRARGYIERGAPPSQPAPALPNPGKTTLGEAPPPR